MCFVFLYTWLYARARGIIIHTKKLRYYWEDGSAVFWSQIWGRRKVMDKQRKWLWEVWQPRKWQWMINRTFCTFRDEGSSCHRRRFCFADDFLLFSVRFAHTFCRIKRKIRMGLQRKRYDLLLFYRWNYIVFWFVACKYLKAERKEIGTSAGRYSKCWHTIWNWKIRRFL